MELIAFQVARDLRFNNVSIGSCVSLMDTWAGSMGREVTNAKMSPSYDSK
jgi:hypothetical protein